MGTTLLDDQGLKAVKTAEKVEQTTVGNGQAPRLADLPGLTGGNGHTGGRNGFSGSGGSRARRPIFSNSRIGLWFLLASITMLFGGFTSTVLVRRVADDWSTIPMPTMVIWSTVILLLSSVTIEVARRRLRQENLEGSLNWLTVTAIAGLLFVLGQWLAWQQLLGQGILLQSTARSAFVYLLMAVHALHVIGGVVGMATVYYKLTRLRPAALAAAEAAGKPIVAGHAPRARESINVFSTYWHFMAGLWVYLLILLFVS